MAALRGAPERLPHAFWPQLLGSAARVVLLVVLIGLLGFGLSNRVRNTAAALGIGFGYFVVLENASG